MDLRDITIKVESYANKKVIETISHIGIKLINVLNVAHNQDNLSHNEGKYEPNRKTNWLINY